jgi:hypothetical protein
MKSLFLAATLVALPLTAMADGCPTAEQFKAAGANGVSFNMDYARAFNTFQLSGYYAFSNTSGHIDVNPMYMGVAYLPGTYALEKANDAIQSGNVTFVSGDGSTCNYKLHVQMGSQITDYDMKTQAMN